MPGRSSIDGIASGLNTTEIVEKLMSLERRQVDLLEDKKAKKNKSVETWRELNTKILALKEAITKLRSFSNFSTKEVTVSNEDILSAEAASGAVEGSYRIKVNALAANHQTISKTGYASETSLIRGNISSFNIYSASGEATNIKIRDDTTLEGLRDAINSGNKNLRASIIKLDNSDTPYRLFITSRNTGEENKFSLRIKRGFATFEDYADVAQEGQDAEIELGDSSTITIKNASNHLSNIIPGMTLDLKTTSQSPINVNVSATSAGASDMITDFVGKYNDVISFIKDQFSLDPVTKKGGTLMGDITLMNMQREIRYAVGNSYKSLTGSVTSLYQTGISSSTTGTLEIDDSKLSDALIDNPTDVRDFFVLGFADKMGTLLIDITTPLIGTIFNKTKTIENQIKLIDEKVARSEVYLARRKEALYAKYTRMEVTLGRLQGQSEFIGQQISSMKLVQNK